MPEQHKMRKLTFRLDESTIFMKSQIRLELRKALRKAALEDLQGRVGRALGSVAEASGEASGESNASQSLVRPSQGKAKPGKVHPRQSQGRNGFPREPASAAKCTLCAERTQCCAEITRAEPANAQT